MSKTPIFKSDTEEKVFQALESTGPMTGKELNEQLPGVDPMDLWRVCYQSNLVRITSFSRYYLRYDVTRENQLRLSPSVLRDFLTYSLVYLKRQQTEAVEKSALLANKHRAISNRKIGFARKAILGLNDDTLEILNRTACFFVSGDLAYFLGHDVPRIHSQLETKVNGSDIDIIIVYNTEVSPEIIRAAEDQMLKIKYEALKDVNIGEEIDFIFKPVSKLMTQLQYRNIDEKIASKILYESFFLYGRLDIYDYLISQMRGSGAQEKIERDFDIALRERKQTIGKILKIDSPLDIHTDENVNSLFFFSQERVEFQ